MHVPDRDIPSAQPHASGVQRRPGAGPLLVRVLWAVSVLPHRVPPILQSPWRLHCMARRGLVPGGSGSGAQRLAVVGAQQPAQLWGGVGGEDAGGVVAPEIELEATAMLYLAVPTSRAETFSRLCELITKGIR